MDFFLSKTCIGPDCLESTILKIKGKKIDNLKLQAKNGLFSGIIDCRWQEENQLFQLTISVIYIDD